MSVSMTVRVPVCVRLPFEPIDSCDVPSDAMVTIGAEERIVSSLE